MNDKTQNSIIIGAIAVLFGLIIIYNSIGGIFDPYSYVANLYSNGVLTSIPEISDVSTCVMGNVLMIVYAVINMISGCLVLISTSCDRGY